MTHLGGVQEGVYLPSKHNMTLIYDDIDEWDFQGPNIVHVGAQDFSETGLDSWDDLQDVPTSPGHKRAHPNAGL